MSWRATSPMSERVKFIGMCLGGGRTMTGLCSEFGISRKTGYKWLNRYKDGNLDGLKEQSRAPRSHPNVTDPRVEAKLLAARKKHPTWGPKKLLWRLHQEGIRPHLPAASTAWAILKRHGLVEARRRRRPRDGSSAPGMGMTRPNEVWCADYKGQFKTKDGLYCYPLTVSDGYSRYLVSCRGLRDTGTEGARPVFERAFRDYGLPWRLRTDNGSPFASTGLARLTALSVWMIKLGIELERIQPGHPEQNGRHERMHRTLKRETVVPPAGDLRAQQRRFDRFRREYNEERPHEALGQRPPGSVYERSPRPYPRSIEDYEYPAHYEVRKVSGFGTFPFRMHAIYANECLNGERLGLVEIDDGIWRVHFRGHELGIVDERQLRRTKRIGYGKVLPMCPI
jgi:putative transposase